MKAGKILLAAAFALTLAVSANAGIHIWWETADGAMGAQGSTLNLECAAGARCEWDLTMYIGMDSASDYVLGWAEDLHVDSAFGGIVTLKESSIPASNPWTSQSSAGNLNSGWIGYYIQWYHILDNAHGLLLAAGGVPGPLTQAALNVTLSVNGAAAGVIDITSEGGNNLWEGSSTTGDFFGAEETFNYTYYGTPYGYNQVRSNAAITINVVPEPTTVAFLGLGALALIRRRR